MPALHGAQLAAPAFENRPMVQLTQFSEADKAAYAPPAQSAHEIFPVASEYAPAGHTRQLVPPVFDWKVPGEQLLQPLEASEAE